MNNRPANHEEPRENDALWQLLHQTPPRAAGPRFADNVTRAARLLPASAPWWKRLVSPLPLATAAAAAVLAVSLFVRMPAPSSVPSLTADQPATEAIADLEELASSETLAAATEHLDSFSDTDLISMIGL